MATRATINFTDLDFDARKASLIQFLKTQNEFKDYNYEGASLNVLMDILAADSVLYATYASFIGNESFQDSAILRSSIVSHAKEKGYVPRSARASKISVGVKVVGVQNNPAALNISKDSRFKGTVSNETFTFTTVQNQSLYPTDVLTGTYEGVVDAYEGSFVVNRFDVTSDTSKFVLPNRDIDSTTLKVTVQVSSTDATSEEYVYSENVMTLTSTSKVFFLQEVDGGFFEIVFGDGVIGYKPQIGNIIFIEYLVCNTGKGNGITTVTFATDLFPSLTTTLTVANPSSGAAVRETDDSVKNNSKMNYAAQDRAVVPDDYKVIVKKMVPDVLDINVWGGEDNVPALYGKTIVSILTNSFQAVPTVQKRSIESMIRQKNVVGIRPMVIDAETSRIRLNGRVRVDRTLMNIPDTDLTTIVKTVIDSFSANNLELFRKSFSYSQLTTLIDKSHPAIKGSLFDVYLINILYPDRTKISSYTVNFNNAITAGSVTCSPFYIPFSRTDTLYYIEDVNGQLKVYGITAGDVTTKTYENGFFGTVDYTTGSVVIAQIQPTPAIDTIKWVIEAKVVDKDVDVKFNQVLFLDSTLSTVNVTTFAN